MRKLFIIIGAFLCLCASAQTKKSIESKIEKVTVFLEGAQTQRSVKVSLAAGKQELIFTGISPSIDKQSIQVKADDNVTVLSVIHQQNFLKEQQKQEEIKELEAQKESLLEKIALQKNIVNVYKQEEIMMTKNQQLAGMSTGLKASDLKEAADFQRSRLTEIYQKQFETDRFIKKLELELSKISRQLIELNQQAETSTSEIHVTVNTKVTASSNFILTYLVKQSGWFPTYDIRVKDISSPISLQYKANVFQSSGEDWKDVKLFLSTGNPNENGTRPVVSPWYLKYVYAYQPVSNTIQSGYANAVVQGKVTDEKGDPLPGASVRIKGTRTGVAADNNGQFKILAKPGDIFVVSGAGLEATEMILGNGVSGVSIPVKRTVIAGTEVVVTALGVSRDASGWTEVGDYSRSRKEMGYSVSKVKAKDAERDKDLMTTITYQPTTTVYEIKEPYTILNDGKTYMADIDGYEIKAVYEYYAAPKLESDAFLTARIVDWQELNLLPGEANLFFEGTFLGKSLLDMENAGDTLNLSLGKDKGVVVRRTLLKDFSSKRFIGSNKTDTRQYEILVRNNKQQPISIVVEDQFPLSTQKEIEVQDRKYEGARLDDDSQRITWQFNVDSKKENKVNFKYEVKYPKDKVLQLN
ncbi:MAG: mucoidy inhibitor MuiA family protein [Chitinophagaceae bacterium]